MDGFGILPADGRIRFVPCMEGDEGSRSKSGGHRGGTQYRDFGGIVRNDDGGNGAADYFLSDFGLINGEECHGKAVQGERPHGSEDGAGRS